MKAPWIESENQILANDAIIFIAVENAKESVHRITERRSCLSSKLGVCNAKVKSIQRRTRCTQDHIAILSGSQPILNILCTIAVWKFKYILWTNQYDQNIQRDMWLIKGPKFRTNSCRHRFFPNECSSLKKVYAIKISKQPLPSTECPTHFLT